MRRGNGRKFFRAEPSARKVVSTGQAAIVKPAYPGLKDLRADRRISRPKGVPFAGYPIRRGNEKVRFRNQGIGKSQGRLTIDEQKPFGDKEHRARNLLLTLWLITLLMRTTGMMPIGMMRASLFSMKDRVMQRRADAGKRKQGNQVGQGHGQHSGEEIHAYRMTYRKLIAIRKSRPTNRGR